MPSRLLLLFVWHPCVCPYNTFSACVSHPPPIHSPDVPPMLTSTLSFSRHMAIHPSVTRTRPKCPSGRPVQRATRRLASSDQPDIGQLDILLWNTRRHADTPTLSDRHPDGKRRASNCCVAGTVRHRGRAKPDQHPYLTEASDGRPPQSRGLPKRPRTFLCHRQLRETCLRHRDWALLAAVMCSCRQGLERWWQAPYRRKPPFPETIRHFTKWIKPRMNRD